jgi:hypothetical protein
VEPSSCNAPPVPASLLVLLRRVQDTSENEQIETIKSISRRAM